VIAVPPDGTWARRDVGPVVRPYAVTGGRTEPEGELLDLMSVVSASGRAPEGDDDPMRWTPEHRKILTLCQRPATVADVASDTGLPVGVVRVLLADLIRQGAITVRRQRPADQQVGHEVLKEILNGLRALLRFRRLRTDRPQDPHRGRVRGR
jgi:hypothetical protein